MEYIYAPWRSGYVTQGEKLDDGCVFCHISKNKELDSQHKVLYRDDVCFAVMNRFPYTPGHFMIIPHFHTQNLEELDRDSWIRISILAQKGVELLKKFGAKGVNLGMNLGIEGGAGIPKHIHLHLVPRWSSDTNFITTIGDTRIYGVDFDDIYVKLLEMSKEYFVV